LPKRRGSSTFRSDWTERVIRELDGQTVKFAAIPDSIQEQLRKCPDAFNAGELIGKMCDTLKYSDDEVGHDRYLPPAGAVMPPLV
jgi:hypothetical protein